MAMGLMPALFFLQSIGTIAKFPVIKHLGKL